MNNLNLGVFPDQWQADAAVTDLEEAGLNPKDMSVITMENEKFTKMDRDGDEGSAVAEGAATGAAMGGLAGLLLALTAVTVPGIGAILIGGPIATALGLSGVAATTVSAAVTGVLAGGVVGALVGLGVPESTAKEYEEQIRKGAVVLAVPTKMSGTRDIAQEIMEKNGATQVTKVSLPNNSRSKRLM